MDIQLTPWVAMGPANVEARVQVAPHSDNRLLQVAVDSGGYYRRTDIQLDGDDAARTHFIVWRALPPGEYVCEVVVYGRDGERHRVRRYGLTIVGEDGVTETGAGTRDGSLPVGASRIR